MSEYIVLFCTVPAKEDAERIAENLISNKLAACVNIIPSLSSIYRWKGEICRDNELLLIIKSRRGFFNKIKDAITSIHPYEVPEIISLPITDGHEPYLAWIKENT